jgi:hypothetical protein
MEKFQVIFAMEILLGTNAERTRIVLGIQTLFWIFSLGIFPIEKI